MFKGIAFVSGKFRGSTSWEVFNNTFRAMNAVPKLLDMGYVPLVPHRIYGLEMQGLYPDKTYLDCCIEIISALRPEKDILFMLEGWQESEGACQEWKAANDLGIEIIYEGEDENV